MSLIDAPELGSRLFHAGVLLGKLLVVASVLEVAEVLARRRAKKPLLDEARNCEIEAAIARVRNDMDWSIWRVEGTASHPAALRLQLMASRSPSSEKNGFSLRGGSMVRVGSCEKSHFLVLATG